MAAEPPLAARNIMTKINTNDLERGVAFYTKMLDLKVAERVNMPDYAQALLNFTGDKNDSLIILHFDKKAKRNGKPFVMGDGFNDLVFTVTDLKATAKRLKDAGHPITDPLITMPAMVAPAKTISLGFTQDPDGFRIELVEWGY
jgi:catechol 2,3-dioxygenase-like lactoylglutathione lyase family enzyme